MLAKIIDRIRPWHVVLAALCSSLLFTFVIYPSIAGPLDARLDSDGYGNLGFGLWRYGELSYYPDSEPTVNRGPIYPAFVAFVLALTNGWYPAGVQVAQAVLFAATCILVFWIGSKLFNHRVAIVAATLCALYPFLIWYTSRIWLEVAGALLFTSIVAALTSIWIRPSILRGIALGSILGIASLLKATFLPLAFVIPVALRFTRHRQITNRHLLAILLTALVVVSAWTIRNWNLTGRIIPVHVLLGYNLERGDTFAKNYWKAPFSYRQLWDSELENLYSVEGSISPDLPRAQREAMRDSLQIAQRTAGYLVDPGFLLKKLALNAWMFWTLGDTPLKSAVIMAMQLPLLLFFGMGMRHTIQAEGQRAIHLVIFSAILAYYAAHLPIMAIARFSVVLVPTMLLYAVNVIIPSAEERES